MKNKEGNTMSREEAVSTLQEVLTTLALNSVHNKRLTDYADDLERYIAFLDQEAEKAEAEKAEAEKKEEAKEEAPAEEAKPEGETADEPKAE